MGERKARCYQHQYPQFDRSEVLLIFEILISCDESLETGASSKREEFPVFRTGPAAFVNRVHIMPQNQWGKPARQLFIEQNEH